VNVLNSRHFHQVVHPVFLGLGLQADHVHAHLAAVVAASEPVPTSVSQQRVAASPRHPVTFTVESKVARLLFPDRTLLSHRQADSSVAAWVHFLTIGIPGVSRGRPEPSVAVVVVVVVPAWRRRRGRRRSESVGIVAVVVSVVVSEVVPLCLCGHCGHQNNKGH